MRVKSKDMIVMYFVAIYKSRPITLESEVTQ